MQTTANPGDILRGPALLFLITWIVHSGDHIRRGTATTPDGVIWAGTLVAILVTVGLTLIFTGHALAPATTAVVFPAVAVGVVATHFLPDWGSLSEPLLVDSQADAFAALAAGLEVVGASILGLAGWRVMRDGGYRLRPI